MNSVPAVLDLADRFDMMTIVTHCEMLLLKAAGAPCLTERLVLALKYSLKNLQVRDGLLQEDNIIEAGKENSLLNRFLWVTVHIADEGVTIVLFLCSSWLIIFKKLVSTLLIYLQSKIFRRSACSCAIRWRL